MECQICYEIFDSKSVVPKILTTCGHSFCKICLDRIINKKFLVNCPVCREKTKINQKDNLPTNYALIRIIEKNKEDQPTKNLLEKYKYFDSKLYKVINPVIIRDTEPRKLILKRIVNDDFIYVEEFENNQNISLFNNYAKRNRRYCFNSKSIFSFFFNEYSPIFMYRKASKCKHEFSCAESILWHMLSSGAFALLVKYPLKWMFDRCPYKLGNDQIIDSYIDYLRFSLFGLSSFAKIFKCTISFYIDELTGLKN